MCQEQMTFVQFDNRGDNDGLLKFEVTQFLNAIFEEHRLGTKRFRESLMRKFIWTGNHMSTMAQCHLRRRNFNNIPLISGDSDIIWEVGDSSAMKTGIVKRHREGEDVIEVESSGSRSDWNFNDDQNKFCLSCIQDIC